MGWSSGRVQLAGGGAVAAGVLVVATGAAQALAPFAPEVRGLSPIKGQILRASWPSPTGGPVLRGAGVYLCPSPGQLVLGASMEPGRGDLDIDPRVTADLLRRASQLSPGLLELDWRAQTGIRAATPDGLPLVGLGESPNLVLAVGARRNGWLLAPLIAEAVVAAVDGRPPPAGAERFDPARRLVSPG